MTVKKAKTSKELTKGVYINQEEVMEQSFLIKKILEKEGFDAGIDYYYRRTEYKDICPFLRLEYTQGEGRVFILHDPAFKSQFKEHRRAKTVASLRDVEKLYKSEEDS